MTFLIMGNSSNYDSNNNLNSNFLQAMKERQIEIVMERDVLALRKRNLLEDKSNLRGEIQERLLKNEQYKKK